MSELNLIAQASANIEPQGHKLTPERIGQAKTIGASLVESLVEIAQNAKERDESAAIHAAWQDVVEILASLDCDTSVYCSKSGKFIYNLTPDHFGDYLAGIARLKETSKGEKLLNQLINAILIQKAHTSLPCYLTISAENNAYMRENSPVDYALQALRETFPLPKRATPHEAAKYAQSISLARVSFERLQAPALSYLCECLHLYLSNIRPSSLALNDTLNTLTIYKDQSLSDVVATPAKIAHFCRRLVQLAYNLIAKHKPRNLDTLTTRDIMHLRVHYHGLEIYKQQRKELRALRHAEKIARQVQAKKDAKEEDFELTPKMREALEIYGDFDQNADNELELEVFDVAAHIRTSLQKPVKIAAETPKQATKYAAIAKTANEAQAANPQPLDPFASFDDGEDFDYTPVIEDETDLIAQGYAEQDEFDQFTATLDADESEEFAEFADFTDFEEPEPAPPAFDHFTMFADETANAMQAAQPMRQTLKPRTSDVIPPSPFSDVIPQSSRSPQSPSPSPSPAPRPALSLKPIKPLGAPHKPYTPSPMTTPPPRPAKLPPITLAPRKLVIRS